MLSHEDPQLAPAKKCGYTLIPARVAALKLMPHAEAHVPVNPDVKRVIPSIKNGPDEGGVLELNDLYMVMLNGEYTTPKTFPHQFIRSSSLEFEPFFKFIKNPTRYHHPSFPNSFNRSLVKHVMSDIDSLRYMLNQMIGFASVLLGSQEPQDAEQTWLFTATTAMLIAPAANGIKMLTGFVSRLRAMILPKTIPEHLRKPIITAPIQSQDIWDIPTAILTPALDALLAAKAKSSFFRGRGRAARGSSYAAYGNASQQSGRGRGGRGRGGYNNNNQYNNNNNRGGGRRNNHNNNKKGSGKKNDKKD